MAAWLDRILFWRSKKKVKPGKSGYINVDPESDGESSLSGTSHGKSGNWLAKLRPSQRREQQIHVLQEGFEELVGLTRTIREHMDQQVQTQKTLVDLMKNMPDAVEGLKSVGKATEQQTETLGMLKQQMEANVRHGEQMIDSFHRFNNTLGRMDETSKSTASTVASLVEKGRESEALLRRALEKSEKRLMCLIAMLAVVTLLVVGAGAYFITGGRMPGSEPAVPPADRGEAVTIPGEVPAVFPIEAEPPVDETEADPTPIPDEDVTEEEVEDIPEADDSGSAELPGDSELEQEVIAEDDAAGDGEKDIQSAVDDADETPDE